jgi:hypothetical protein
VDAVAAAAVAHDSRKLDDQIRYTKQPCVVESEVAGIDGRPRCVAGESTGDLVDAFLTPQCEGVFIRDPEMIRSWVDQEFAEVTRFFGAYTSSSEKVGKYAIAFSTDTPNQAVVALVDDVGIVGVGNLCGGTPQQLFGLRTPIAPSSTP